MDHSPPGSSVHGGSPGKNTGEGCLFNERYKGKAEVVKDPDAGRDWGQEGKGMTEDEMAGWHHRLDGHEFECLF